ncbi:NAD(+) synthase [Anaerovorax odorimutans]|uniref:Glutamine-dependent NAD(+) synthetase n=1 Tax=Anaerovorax odorimutans TaxID=109327 RepID=A0ABT1RKS4_9FIRM|nr:NAD(+) synthase [Anaerovorax odorimutans]MCQ4635780.1 NAD(+) synthase [Anaerovorax odorimutans]
MKHLGLVRVGAAVPALKVANTKYNTQQILALLEQAEMERTGFLVFPELAITGYTCGDLFYQEHLYQSQLDGLAEVVRATENKSITVVLGCYLRIENNLYNCAALIQGGSIMGVVPKMFLPNSKEYYEARWFASGIDLSRRQKTVRLFGKDVPFGHLLFFDEAAELCVGMEICEDLWLPASPGSQLALAGAQIIFNTSASNDTVGKADYRRALITVESAKSNCGYVYTSAGVSESTTDVVFSGHSLIAENGIILKESDRFARESGIVYSEIDFERILFERSQNSNMSQCATAFGEPEKYQKVFLSPVTLVEPQDKLYRHYDKNPFVPEDNLQVNRRCGEIFSLQAAGLAKRIEHSHSRKSVVGISGGLDSTLALLVCAYTHKLIGRPASDIVAVTMPGFGTTGKTYNNALTIMKLLGAEVREISIKDSVNLHFEDIGHDPQVHDVTYENSQARERTQILMDTANKEGGLVVGTGDLSEMALGWCTYNGDHMSMYGVNASVPKTLVRFVVKWVMENKLSGPNEDPDFSSDNALLKTTLQDILDTPISPELLPPDPNGDIAQKTEESVGPYILHDFFIYYTIRYGMEPEKLLFTAKNAFAGEYDEAFIKKWMATFYRRFFAQQFKRSCVPDGPKVGSVSLSPRGDWRMPSDADAAIWLDEIK